MTDAQNALAQAIADAQRLYTEQHRDHDRAHRLDERLGTMEYLEREAVESIKETLLPLIDQLDCNDPIRKIVGVMCDPKQPVQLALLIPVLAAIGYVLGNAAAAGPVSSLAMSSMRNFGSYALSPESMAAAAWTDRISDQQARNRAADSGVSDDKFIDMVETVKQTIPPGTALELWQRGEISDDEMNRFLRRSALDDESTTAFRKLKLGPIDISTAVAAVTQSQITMDQFRTLLAQGGIDPQWADVIFKTAGQSPSVQETLELWNRGLIDEATVDKIVLESPIKNEYVPVLKLMRHRFPALEQTTTLMRRGIMTLEEGKDAIRKLGYTPELADKMATYASTAQSGSAKNLTVGQMTQLFELGQWDEGKLTARLVAAGFDADEAADILDLAKERKTMARIERAATSIGTRYVSWKIDRGEAVTLLDRINVPGATRDEMLEVWDARREAQTLHLSEAFLHKAYKQGVITREQVEPRLLAMGYDAIDTAIIMATDFAPPKLSAKQRDLSRADHKNRYEKGIITAAQFRDALLALGYDADEAAQILELSDAKLAADEAKETALNGA